mmetsp:Transcript_1085/g.2336  ORF Transcript_1085/g.2336 Transcript_1085/m.2336 type:complete len:192 (+) Transcript_1085:168-743(+)
MNTSARFCTTAVRQVTGTIATSAARPMQRTTRTFMAPSFATFPTNAMFQSATAHNGIHCSTPLSQQTTTTATNNDEQRRFRSNRSRRGLYDGKDIRTGNNLSFSMRHTKRTFKPNVFVKRVYSEILDEMVRFHLTTSTLRSIDKCGGLDNYLLTSKHITSGEGLQTKKRIINALKYRERKAQQQQQATTEA